MGRATISPFETKQAMIGGAFRLAPDPNNHQGAGLCSILGSLHAMSVATTMSRGKHWMKVASMMFLILVIAGFISGIPTSSQDRVKSYLNKLRDNVTGEHVPSCEETRNSSTEDEVNADERAIPPSVAANTEQVGNQDELQPGESIYSRSLEPIGNESNSGTDLEYSPTYGEILQKLERVVVVLEGRQNVGH